MRSGLGFHDEKGGRAIAVAGGAAKETRNQPDISAGVEGHVWNCRSRYEACRLHGRVCEYHTRHRLPNVFVACVDMCPPPRGPL